MNELSTTEFVLASFLWFVAFLLASSVWLNVLLLMAYFNELRRNRIDLEDGNE